MIFVIGIGGTGMRCLEAFVHLCAMGMFDNQEINILALDTDRENGNFYRLRELTENYIQIKSPTQIPQKDSFFSAKINYYEYYPDYSLQQTSDFRRLAQLIYAADQERDLANLLFTPATQNFNLLHGYRAQTHLGSLLMYHAILEEVRNKPKGSLGQFINQLQSATEHSTPRIFLMGSVFGGTGASSIPILPKALNEALRLMTDSQHVLENFYLGSILLTHYFKFDHPDTQDLEKKEGVIANARNFALNSQAAIMFYEEDRTVKSIFQKFYLLGTPKADYTTPTKKDNVITGGRDQENDSHFIELLAACAAYDFFYSPEEQLAKIKNTEKKAHYYYRTIDTDISLQFRDFLDSPTDIAKFTKKFGCFTALSFLTLNDKFFDVAKHGKNLPSIGITTYNDLPQKAIDALKRYMELFHFKIENNTIKNGWLRQLQRSVATQGAFLFHPDIFTDVTSKLQKYNWSKLFDSNLKHHNFKTGILGTGLGGGTYDAFMEAFNKQKDGPSTNLMEKLLKRVYDTLITLYNFN
ncbi:MAG: tubulin-like doman-containing protein [Bacteroidia bacterium]|nr:tubulin-like doman-containing protein [Bacteroidia bacterium]MDW8159136.1 tubulin-like doman-containing protein [Bacteroidia bacterium]